VPSRQWTMESSQSPRSSQKEECEEPCKYGGTEWIGGDRDGNYACQKQNTDNCTMSDGNPCSGRASWTVSQHVFASEKGERDT
jgi:phosphoenolpyruvate carboxylase